MARARNHAKEASQAGVAATTFDIIKEFVRLFATEFRLLRIELGEKAGVIGVAAGLAIGGAFLLFVAVLLLFGALIAALAEHGLSLSAATLIVFAAVLITGAGCLWFGIRQFRAENLLPNKTIAQVQKDFHSIAPET